ncbi:unnamed protein product, partial [marine sediment metagenome]
DAFKVDFAKNIGYNDENEISYYSHLREGIVYCTSCFFIEKLNLYKQYNVVGWL